MERIELVKTVDRVRGHKDFIQQTLGELVQKIIILLLLKLFSEIKQKDTEGVIEAPVIAEETSCGQIHRHFVIGVQVQHHNDRRTVLLVAVIFIYGSSHHCVINLQTSTGSQLHSRSSGVTVDCEGDAVDTRVGSSEDTGRCIVGIAQIEEDMCVDDKLVFGEGAVTLFIVE